MLGTDFFPLAIPPGHHALDAFAKWHTNGVMGSRDIKDAHGITCEADPKFAIEKLQKIAGKGGFTTETVPVAHVGQTVEYEIIVTNTGNVPLKMSGFSDPKCESISGGPGEKPLEVGEQTVFTCHHVLNHTDGEAGIDCNVAEVTGEDGPPKTQESNTVCVELPEKSNFTQEATCKSMTIFLFGFPKTNGNTVTEVIRVDGKIFFKGQFTFGVGVQEGAIAAQREH